MKSNVTAPVTSFTLLDTGAERIRELTIQNDSGSTRKFSPNNGRTWFSIKDVADRILDMRHNPEPGPVLMDGADDTGVVVDAY